MKSIGDQAKAFRQWMGWNYTELAREVQKHFKEGVVNRQKITQLEEAGSRRPQYLAALAKAMGTTVEVLEAGLWSPPDEPSQDEQSDGEIAAVAPAASPSPASDGIDLYYAKGSCGGGSIATHESGLVKQKLIKEPSWFQRYGVRPQHLMAIYADGDSMADYIVDGDIVIFDTSKTSLVTGKIFAIDTPDGLRIKRVHKKADGSVILASDNSNKTHFPDEEYRQEEANRLVVKGVFVYRQGG